MTISPWLTFEKIKDYETRITEIETNGGALAKPLAPSAPSTTRWYVNSVTGDDNNDGLSSGTAYATMKKATDQLSLYDFDGGNAEIRLNQVSADGVSLKANNFTNMEGLTFRNMDGTQNSGSLLIDRQYSAVELTLRNLTFTDSGSVCLIGGNRVDIINIEFIDRDAGSYAISVFDHDLAEIDVDILVVASGSDDALVRLENVNRATVNVVDIGGTFAEGLVSIGGGVNFIDFSENGIHSVTGPSIFFENNNEGIAINNAEVLPGTAPTFPNFWINNGVPQVILPAYDDDAAAGVGGLVAGDMYQTTGSGAAPLNAAGLILVKQ